MTCSGMVFGMALHASGFYHRFLMTTAPPYQTPENQTRQSIRSTDWRLASMLAPYALRHQRLLAIALLLLVPVSIGNALQPVLVGQAISLIRNEPVMFFSAEG